MHLCTADARAIDDRSVIARCVEGGVDPLQTFPVAAAEVPILVEQAGEAQRQGWVVMEAPIERGA